MDILTSQVVVVDQDMVRILSDLVNGRVRGGSGGSKSFSFSFGGFGGPGSFGFFGFGLNDIFSDFFGGDTKGGVQFRGFGSSTRSQSGPRSSSKNIRVSVLKNDTLSYFIISKNYFINYTIPFYNTSYIQNSIILLFH